jgi:hypothetical protein
MKRGYAVAVWMGFLVMAAPLAAQRGGPPGEAQARMRGPGGGAGVERAVALMLKEREALELSDAQVTELESLQAEVRDVTTPIREEQAEARERWAGGELTPEEMTEMRRQWAERSREILAPLHERMEGILSEEQHEQFRRLMWETQRRAMRSGRGDGGRAARPGRGLGSAYESGFRDGFRAGRGMRRPARWQRRPDRVRRDSIGSEA